MTIEQHTFQAEIKQLLHILVHSLYKERDIFLRELVSNASDALNKLQFVMLTQPDVLDADAPLEIHITVNPEAKTILIQDSGIGMTHDDLINNLGVIAQSSIQGFMQQMQTSEGSAKTDLIGQFGVGFYSVFMVADRVEVTSKPHLADQAAYSWVCTGEDRYEIHPADKVTRGTDILIHLREDAGEFAESYRLRQAIKQHSDYIAFPIFLHDTSKPEAEEAESTPVNQQKALWRRSPSEVEAEEYNNFYRAITMDFNEPVLRIHTQADAPIQYYGLLFIPKSGERNMFSLRKEPGLKLYARKVLIQEYTTDLLPDYLQFVQGVVDSEDIPLNVSRETVQANALMAKLKKAVTGKVLNELKRVAQNDPALYSTIWGEFGNFLKHGVVADYEDREKLLPLLRFYSNQSEGELVALDEYIERMANTDGQTAIYYLVADGLSAASHSPHLAPFRERGIEVLYMLDNVDGFMLRALHEYKGHTFVSADSSDLDLNEVGRLAESDPQEEMAQDEMEALLEAMRGLLGQTVEEVRVSKVLTSPNASPARLVAPDGALDRHTQRVYQLLEKDFQTPKRILEVNPHHPIIRNLAAHLGNGDEVLETGIQVLYGNALLLDGIHPNPAELAQQVQKLLEVATR
jgi:molecular chaperone HtpG